MVSNKWLLLLILLLGFTLRFGINSEQGQFSSPEDYYVLRHINSIQQEGEPIFNDELSYGGRVTPVLPFYYYILSSATLIGNWFAFVVLPAILATLIGIAVYLFAANVTSSYLLAVFSAYIALFLPAFFRISVRTITPIYFGIVILFFCLWLFVKVEKTKAALPWLVIFSVLLALSSHLIFLLIMMGWVYVGLLRVQGIRIHEKSFEYLIFTTIFGFVIQNLIYLGSSISKGPLGFIINVPKEMMINKVPWAELFGGIGLLVVVLGVYGVYLAIQQDTKKREATWLLTITATTTICGFLGFLTINSAFSILGTALAIASVYSLEGIAKYIRRFKMPTKVISFLLVFLLLVPLFISAIAEGSRVGANQVSVEDIRAMNWLKANSPEGSTIFGPVETGHLISGIARRKNIADTNFLYAPDVTKRLEDLKKAYQSPYVPLL